MKANIFNNQKNSIILLKSKLNKNLREIIIIILIKLFNRPVLVDLYFYYRRHQAMHQPQPNNIKCIMDDRILFYWHMCSF